MFLKISQGSGAELKTQFIISYNLSYLSQFDYNDLSTELDGILRMFTKLHQSLAQTKETE